MSTTAKDNSEAVKKQLNSNIKAALTAMGQMGVYLTVKNMQEGYGKPIRQTGDLMRDVSFLTNVTKRTVTIGNSLEYAPWVHDGTRKMKARAYLRDALLSDDAKQQLQEVAAEQLKKGFNTP